MIENQLTIDFDTADRITVLNLLDYKKYLEKELEDYKNGEYLHSEDVEENTRCIEAIDIVLRHFDL